MILLSNTDTTVVITGGLIILAIFTVVTIIKMKLSNNAKGKSMAEDFLVSLSDEIYALMIKNIKEIDIEGFNFESLEEFEAKVLGVIYTSANSFVKNKIDELDEDAILPSVALKLLFDQDFVDKFTEEIFNNGHVEDIIKDAWSKYFQTKVESMEENTEDVAIGHDVDGNEIIYSGPDYNEDFDEKNDLPLAEEEEIDPEALSKVIPPSDDEEPYYDEDVIEENEPFFIDKNGRKRDKKTGRYTK